MKKQAVLLNNQEDFRRYMEYRKQQGLNVAQDGFANHRELGCGFPMYMMNDFMGAYGYRHPRSNPEQEQFKIISLQEATQ